jgi:hypothetical protein
MLVMVAALAWTGQGLSASVNITRALQLHTQAAAPRFVCTTAPCKSSEDKVLELMLSLGILTSFNPAKTLALRMSQKTARSYRNVLLCPLCFNKCSLLR